MLACASALPPHGSTTHGSIMMRFLLIALAATAIVAAAPPGPGAAPAAPSFTADTTTIAATGTLQWEIPFTIRNPAASTFTLDSLRCEVTVLDPGTAPEGRTMDLDLGHLLRVAGPIEAGGASQFVSTGPAYAEHARLRFRLVGHLADKWPLVFIQEIEAVPGPFSIAHPSRFLVSNGRPVEFVLVSARNTTVAAPGVLLVHGHGGNARTMLSIALYMSLRGYAVMVVSMPGYGRSEGPADFMGPATVAAASAALDTLKASPGVDPRRLGVWGISRGATVAAELGMRRADLDAVVAQSGIYDLWATYRGTRLPGFREAIVAEAGRDSAAWKARSPLLAAERFQSSILVMHGELDDHVPAGQAHAFVDALQAHGKNAASRFFPTDGHALPRGDTFRHAIEYLKQHLIE